MSLDKSLKSKNTLQRHRNVLTRAERIAVLKDTGRWEEESTPIGLPKVAHRKAAVGKKDKAKKKEAETAEAEAEATEKKE
ncbi:MAG: small basic protein [Phycisphaerales bacterium]|nr:MAG: small basic protein [Phycisphaerales bacterium]